MDEVKKCINEAINNSIEYQVIINSLKRELPHEAVYNLYRAINSGPDNINTNFYNFLKKNQIEGVSKSFVRNSTLTNFEFF
jgi:hypothetical protein